MSTVMAPPLSLLKNRDFELKKKTVILDDFHKNGYPYSLILKRRIT